MTAVLVMGIYTSPPAVFGGGRGRGPSRLRDGRVRWVMGRVEALRAQQRALVQHSRLIVKSPLAQRPTSPSRASRGPLPLRPEGGEVCQRVTRSLCLSLSLV